MPRIPSDPFCSWRPYADALSEMGVPVAREAELRLGDGTVVRYRVRDLIPVYRPQRTHLQRLLHDHYARRHPGALGKPATELRQVTLGRAGCGGSSPSRAEPHPAGVAPGRLEAGEAPLGPLRLPFWLS